MSLSLSQNIFTLSNSIRLFTRKSFTKCTFATRRLSIKKTVTRISSAVSSALAQCSTRQTLRTKQGSTGQPLLLSRRWMRTGSIRRSQCILGSGLSIFIIGLMGSWWLWESLILRGRCLILSTLSTTQITHSYASEQSVQFTRSNL